MRHLPSDSLLCESAYGESEHGEYGYVNRSLRDEHVSPRPVQREVVNGYNVLGSDIELADMASLHPHAGGLGAARHACLCGWVEGAMCYIPRYVCDDVDWAVTDETVARYCTPGVTGYLPVPRPGGPSRPVGPSRPGETASETFSETFDETFGEASSETFAAAERVRGESDGDRIRNAVVLQWQSSWECTSMAPSESWGVLNATSMHKWMLTKPPVDTPLSVRETIQHGRVGLRVGRLVSVLRDKEWKHVLHPKKRSVPLSGPAGSTLGQRWCVKNRAEMLPASYADRFVDELFPAAQGVTENVGLAFCLRVVVEAARLRVLQLAAAGTGGTVAARFLELVQDQEVVLARWRRRCLQQVHVVSMCTLRGVFDM